MGDIEWEWIFTSSRAMIKLRDLCVNKMIQDSWRSEIIQLRSCRNLGGLFLYPCVRVRLDLKFQFLQISWNEREKDAHESESESRSMQPISLSRKFELMIQCRAEQMKKQFKRWFLTFPSNADFDGDEIFIQILNNFDEFVYDTFGDIDGTQTAKKIVECKKIDQRTKFVFAYIYCFEDEVKRLWPYIGPEKADFDADFSDRTPQLIRYWVCRMTNQHVVEDWRIFTKVYTLSAMEYFLNRIQDFGITPNGVDARVFIYSLRICAITIPDMLAVIARYWFPKFDDKFMESLVAFYGSSIIVRLMDSPVTWKFILPIWLHTKKMFSHDNFVDIFIRVFEVKEKRKIEEDEMIEDDASDVCELSGSGFLRGCGRLSNEIWSNASEELRNYALNQFQEMDVLDKFESLISS